MRLLCSVLSFVVVLVCTNGATAATLRATYLFNDTLAAQESTAPALQAVDPLSLNRFEADLVYGQHRRVYHWDGNEYPSTQQAGLSLSIAGVIPTNNYSVEIVFAFGERKNSWRRILEVQNRASDNGLYVDSSNHLAVYPAGSGSTEWTNGVYHHVVLTDASTSTVKGYLDGTLQFLFSTTVMHIQNGNLLHFFLDNTGGGDFSDGWVALIRVYEGVLTDSEVSQLAQNPFATPLCDIQMSKPSYANGDTVTAQVARLANPGPNPVPVIVMLWFELPGSPSVPFLTVGANGSFVLTPGFNQDFGALPLATVQASFPRGQYHFNCRLLHAVTGALLVEDFNPFQLE